ncbi:hypothetical protein PCPL58_p5026 (plasmid) [Pseudomonas cerasi]|nr:hypothetical protein PCPL58_p5026 [Pseudomonas cerasi]
MVQLHLVKRWMPTPLPSPIHQATSAHQLVHYLPGQANFVGRLGEAVSHQSQVL